MRWKQIYPDYFITDTGIVYTKKKGKLRIKKSNKVGKGYRRVTICYEPMKNITVGLHRLVALAFIPNPDNKEQVNHIDGNKENNHYTNLEWVTNKENCIHATRFPSIKFVINKDIANEIRRVYNSGITHQHKLADLFKLPFYIISVVVRNKAWVTDNPKLICSIVRTNRQCKIYTTEQAEKVRNAYFKHRISVTNLAKMCEVSECHIRRILKNKLLCPIR